MCRRVTCPKCHKPTFAGCGAHIEQVLGDVPRDQRCSCSDVASAGETPTSIAGSRSWWPFSR